MPSPDRSYISWHESTDPLDRVGNFFGRLTRSRCGRLAALALGLEGTSISLAAACTFQLQVPAIVRPAETPGASDGLILIPTRTATPIAIITPTSIPTETPTPPPTPTRTPTRIPTSTPAPQPEKDPASEKILLVPQLKQQNLDTCEATAAAMAIAFLDPQNPVSEKTIMDKLPRNLNPDEGFRDGYGVNAEPLASLLQRPPFGFTTEVSFGHEGLEKIRKSIKQGQPVIVWMTFDTWSTVPQQVKLPNGQTVELVPWEHVVVVVGYDQTGVWVNDPWDGTRKYYSNADFLRAWEYFKQMTLTIRR